MFTGVGDKKCSVFYISIKYRYIYFEIKQSNTKKALQLNRSNSQTYSLCWVVASRHCFVLRDLKKSHTKLKCNKPLVQIS